VKSEQPPIVLKKVRVHNLKGVDLTLPAGKLVLFTGVSGSGKSSLAFDTIYVEGQRRYVELLSPHVRRQMGELPKPEAEEISGISPTVAIEQKSASKNPRSTVGTLTSIHDFLRVLFARLGLPHCPISGRPLAAQSEESMLGSILAMEPGTKLIFLSPYLRGKEGTLAEECSELQRKGFTRGRIDGSWIELGEPPLLDPTQPHDLDVVVDRLVVQPEERGRVAESLHTALELSNGSLLLLQGESHEEKLLSRHGFSKESGLSYEPLEPHDFSFNHPRGMCPTCRGLGQELKFDLTKIIDPSRSIEEDCCSVASSFNTVRYGNIYRNLARLYHFNLSTPWQKLSDEAKEVFLYGSRYGSGQKWLKMIFHHPEKGSRWTEFVAWKGVLHEARERFDQATSEFYRTRMRQLMSVGPCSACVGARLRPYPAATKLFGRTIGEISQMPVSEALQFFSDARLTESERLIGEELLKEVVERFSFLERVGLHYLQLDRSAPTLSGGESQRVRLASQIGAGLTGATYVLDEPSIGLHPRDNQRLIESLKALRDLGNSVLVVEHDEETIRAADLIVDLGPLAGELGGEKIYEGDFAGLLKCKRSLTGDYLAGRKSIPIPETRRPGNGNRIRLCGARHHNLKSVDLTLPLGLFVAVTGVSGSGKSSLILDLLYPALANRLQGAQLEVGPFDTIEGWEGLEKVVAIDAAPIGRTPRSNPATYVKLFDEIRTLFSSMPESLASGLTPSHFSFNMKEGSCPHCKGLGAISVDMDFLEEEWIECLHCQGKRFDERILSVTYKGKTIHDVLELSCSEAFELFSAIPKIASKLELLERVGLGYLRLGQSSTTLSGGEAQRIKLARELSRPSNGKSLYILDEPTTGLHFHDVERLIRVLTSLVERGDTVVVIEHNMDLVKVADLVIELGPEGGAEGGLIIAQGSPEEVAKLSTPTAEALRPHHAVANATKISPKAKAQESLRVIGAEQNYLKKLSVTIPHGSICICTGPSGSGKSSFALETVYAEGQRRYVESLSPHARQLVGQMPKPKVERIEGLRAALAIEQKRHAGNPRSTVGTMTEIYDYLRLLFAHAGVPHAPGTNRKLERVTPEFVVARLLELTEGEKLQILAPLEPKKGQSWGGLQQELLQKGFIRVRLDGEDLELTDPLPFTPGRKHRLELVVDRIVVKKEASKRLLDAVKQVGMLGSSRLLAVGKEENLFHFGFVDPATGLSYPAITPHTFSFNTEGGMCSECEGLGAEQGIRLESLADLEPMEWISLLVKERMPKEFRKLVESQLKEERSAFFQGATKALPSPKDEGVRLKWRGLTRVMELMLKSAPRSLREQMSSISSERPCRACLGARLSPLALAVKIEGRSIGQLCQLPIEELLPFLEKVSLSEEQQQTLAEPMRQIRSRLLCLTELGAGYLSLARTAPTLSGGETQRIRLARQLGGGLSGCLYVLDEPTIGLHPHNASLLHHALKQLKEQGNTLLLVEHDPSTLQLADQILDFGPTAGKAGGRIVASGTLKEICNNPHSLTGAYLSGRKQLPYPAQRRKPAAWLRLDQLTRHNLKNLSVKIPLGCLVGVTGVSGAGKSSLIEEIQARRYGEIESIISLEQTPLGQTARADISSYTDLLTPLRQLYASLGVARLRGLEPRHFSPNHRAGMCTTCDGLGYTTVRLQFLPDVQVVCEGCRGARLKPASLEVRLHGLHLGALLQKTVDELIPFMAAWPRKIEKLLSLLSQVGLGYLQIGQEVATLSGGEAQRLRLARELATRTKGKSLYLLDEPSVGLHSDDIAKLLPIFQSLVDKGHTIIMIEHQLELLAACDQIIDLGPEGGERGGQIVGQGTPEELATLPSSYTGRYLKQFFNEKKKR